MYNFQESILDCPTALLLISIDELKDSRELSIEFTLRKEKHFLSRHQFFPLICSSKYSLAFWHEDFAHPPFPQIHAMEIPLCGCACAIAIFNVLHTDSSGASHREIRRRTVDSRSSTVLVVADADGALGAGAVGPPAADVNVGLRHVGVGEEQPEAEDGLGEHVEDGVCDDLGIDAGNAGAVGNTPNAWTASV